jgi:hypothetical protein
MNGCPDVEALLQAGARPSQAVQEHVTHCEGCANILALDAFRRLPDRAVPPEECAEALPLIAACSEGLLDVAGLEQLAPHLAFCKSCRETLVEMTLGGDEIDDMLDGDLRSAGDAEALPVDEPVAPAAPRRLQVPSRKESMIWKATAAISFAAVVAAVVAATTAAMLAHKALPPPASSAKEPLKKRARELPPLEDTSPVPPGDPR